MSSEFELSDDGELICKHADRRGVIEAMKLAIAKNSDEDNPAAFRPEPGSDQEDEAEDETPAQRRARLRRLLAEADARERRRNGAPKRKAWTVDDLTAIAETMENANDATGSYAPSADWDSSRVRPKVKVP
jgi:hypothetical protein